MPTGSNEALKLKGVTESHNFFKDELPEEVVRGEREEVKGHERARSLEIPEDEFCAGVIKRNLAAMKIQTRFRGWLVRNNLKIVTQCCIKIQALWRGALVRMHRKRRSEVKTDRKSVEPSIVKSKPARSKSPKKGGNENLTTKIQTHTTTAKTKLRKSTAKNQVHTPTTKTQTDDDTAAKIQTDTLPTTESGKAARISGASFGLNSSESLDSAQGSVDSLLSTVESDTELRIRMESALKCLETILKDCCGEDLTKVSKTRVTELVKFLDTNPDSTKSDVCLANSLARLCPEPTATLDEDDQNIVKVDPEKVGLLKEAIRLLRLRIQTWEDQKLYRYHHLARTRAIPGVFSDPFSGELTEIEKKLANIRVDDWEKNYISPAKFKTENTKQMKDRVTFDPEEEKTLEKIYNFKVNYFPTGGGDDDLTKISFSGGSVPAPPKQPPPFTTLFKSNPKRKQK